LLKETPLSVAQERLWVLDQLYSDRATQNLSCGFRITGPFDQGAWQAALQEVAAQHEILRTEFRVAQGKPIQVVQSAIAILATIVDLRDCSQQELDGKFAHLRRDETKKRFDLNDGSLWRSIVFHLTDAHHVLLIVAHRLVCDEISIRVLCHKAARLYGTRRTEIPVATPVPSLQYSDVAASRAVASAEHLSYWKQRLQGAPSTLDLPADRQRPPVQSFRAAGQKILLEPHLLQKIQILSKSCGVTLSATLFAILAILLSRHTRQDHMVIGMRVSGRQQPELDTVIGPLENLLALRVDASGDLSFRDFLTRMSEVMEEALLHQDVPFQSVLKQLSVERDMSRHPLFQEVFTPLDFVSDAILQDDWSTNLLEVESAAEPFDLSLQCAKRPKGTELSFIYNPDLFDPESISRISGHFQVLLQSAVENPWLTISRMPLLTERERHQLLVEWNDTRVDYPRNKPLHQFIEMQVEKTPNATAVVYETERLTYGQLNARANQLAHYLQTVGVGPDVLVAVCLHRSLALVTALLAILKAGGAYVPLDPEYPKDRIETMLRDANPPIVLTDSKLLDQLPADVRKVFCFDRDFDSIASEPSTNLPISLHGKNLAYAIYTSGSTGKPKGVPNVHEGIVNRLLWMQDAYKLTSGDRVLQKTPFSFDVSVWEFFWPLMTGATLVVAIPGGHRDSAYLVKLIADQGITTLHFVPSMLSIFLETDGLERCRSLRQVFASGEALPFELQQRFFERLGCELHNLYGPTEAAVDVTYWACRPNSQQPIVPIGRPIANTQIYILDTNLEPVPIGVAGELHIGGIGLAQGYLNRPDLTAQKFIPDPFSNATTGRLYKTGDLARFLTDGNIEYLGRIDHQVKLRGFRIELGEIEAVLGELSGVRQAVVSVREDVPGDKRLVAYLIAFPGHELDIERVRKELKEKLPEHMVPSSFAVLAEFPMTTSGKVDRKALPAPPQERKASGAVIPPRNEMESKLASVFGKVLGLASVSVTDNFFDLGGHSLTAARLLAEVKEITGRQIPLSTLFRSATVEALAESLDDHEDDNQPVVMQIQAGDARGLPFFAIVPPAEEALGYAILARHMGTAQSVYKIQGHAPIVGKRPYTEEEMQLLATEYAAAMRSVQPEGPYCLGGLCDGAHIGERVLLELESQGQEVALFAVIDTWVLQNSQRPLLWRVDYVHQRLRQVSNRSFGEQIQLYKRAINNKIRKLTGKRSARTDWEQAYWPSNYVPPRFHAPVILFKRPKQPFYYVKDPLMGWGPRTAKGVEVHEIDFDHNYLLREPHVRILGEKLVACIERASIQAGGAQGESFRPEQTET
jgi:amino acid adenylation domain-containing protein